ncbi:hypothetical protein PTSG_02392 [Salpingoeca rosetta]|uniref:Uncharacterized protein n=1 Tax=Salpingoeca rosetta (strain ATCC 50818 / BSB-021) TaxID=946362 RepID=F2U226_SALR5|nr:uncharacterized protein PTSG_02392 [Salpingoeca rosetta]EGD81678.1 hypothetical protein PTSG_02392 [Salpingoeca rosetta]|eukprot:XP_004996882.1 hypothetical protein PTSG_02392 [Salpingoeca rosetta]
MFVRVQPHTRCLNGQTTTTTTLREFPLFLSSYLFFPPHTVPALLLPFPQQQQRRPRTPATTSATSTPHTCNASSHPSTCVESLS